MKLEPLPFVSPLDAYRQQAEELLAGHSSGDELAIRVIHSHHPRFLDRRVPWLPRRVPDSEIRGASFDLGDAQLTLARWYCFQDWPTLAAHVEMVIQVGSPTFRFESAVEAVVSGDLPRLASLLRDDPELVRARSARITCFDPPVHRATLLHYVAANGVEAHHEKTPPGAVDIAKALLDAGADVEALADMHGGHYATMSMLVSSSHPANAGVQIALIDALVDHGAAVDARGSARWGSPLMTALAFGFTAAAEALVRRGAWIDDLAAAAGLGRYAEAARMLPGAGAESRHRALALAAQLGHSEIVRLLLDAGEDPSRLNPEANHSHSTPLHQAALAGHQAAVQLLVERGARLDVKDTIFQATPLGWANHAHQSEVAAYLRAHGAQ